jgi:hypothetical protein
MTSHSLAAVVAACGVTPAVSAQVQTATYSLVFTSPTASSGNGTANIVVGGHAEITAHVLVSLNPGIGGTATGPGTLSGTILGLSSGSFSITGGGVNVGSWSAPALVSPYNFALGNSAGAVAGQSVNGAIWGLGLVQPPHPSPQSPDEVWTGTFTTGSAIGVATFTFTGLGPVGVWALPPPPSLLPFESPFAANGVQGSVFNHPAPAGALLLGLAGLVALRRRR